MNWRFYDTIYTERFMRTPQENPDGYDKNSPIHFVEDLKGKLLIAHGTGDDNVHFQNSLVLINQLIKKNKNYDLLVYPNRQHAIYKDNAHFHLYMEMTKYIEENL